MIIVNLRHEAVALLTPPNLRPSKLVDTASANAIIDGLVASIDFSCAQANLVYLVQLKAGWGFYLEIANVGRELIVNFHGLGEPPGFVDSEEKIYWLPIINFTRLLDQILERQPTAEPKVAITFDDGNASDALLALPELVKRGLTASFFVCAGRIGKQHYLDEVMIKDLLAAGMRVGSHGMDHLDWRELDSAGLDREIGQARRKLEDVIQQSVTTVAIPFGSYDRRVLKRLACETWDTIYTVDGGIADCASKVKTRVTVEACTQYRDLVQNLLCPPQLHVQLRRALVLLWKQLR